MSQFFEITHADGRKTTRLLKQDPRSRATPLAQRIDAAILQEALLAKGLLTEDDLRKAEAKVQGGRQAAG